MSILEPFRALRGQVRVPPWVFANGVPRFDSRRLHQHSPFWLQDAIGPWPKAETPASQAASISTLYFNPAASSSACSANRTSTDSGYPRTRAHLAARSGLTVLRPFSTSQRCDFETP